MNPTVVLLPGLGADHRLFRSQHAVLPDIVIPAWPPTGADDSLASFAGRFVDSIPKADGLYLGGSSFGGMVALELAALVGKRVGKNTRAGRVDRPDERARNRRARLIDDGAAEIGAQRGPGRHDGEEEAQGDEGRWTCGV